MQRFRHVRTFGACQLVSLVVFEDQTGDVPHVILPCHIVSAVHIVTAKRVQRHAYLCGILLHRFLRGCTGRTERAVEKQQLHTSSLLSLGYKKAASFLTLPFFDIETPTHWLSCFYFPSLRQFMPVVGA